MVENYGINDPAALLVEVEKAILKILEGGQSYKIGTRSVTRADLSTLISMRDGLRAEAEQAERGLFARTSVAVFDGR